MSKFVLTSRTTPATSGAAVDVEETKELPEDRQVVFYYIQMLKMSEHLSEGAVTSVASKNAGGYDVKTYDADNKLIHTYRWEEV